MKDLSRLPRPILDHRPQWIDLYWRAWATFVPPPDWNAGDLVHGLAVLTAGEDKIEPVDGPGAAHSQLDAWCARFAPPHLPPPDLAPRLSALLLGQIIGLHLHADPNGETRRILWRLTETPPVGVEALIWDGCPLDLLADRPRGGGLTVQVSSPMALILEIITPHTTYMELVAPGRSTLTLTVLDRTDVQANRPA